MRTELFKFFFALLVLAVPICYAPFLVSHHAVKKEASVRYNESSQAMIRIFLCARNDLGLLPDDVCDPEGKPIMSWRAVVNDEQWIPPHEINSTVNLRDPWNSPENLEAAKNKPVRFYYPQNADRSDPTLTCVLRVREVHERFKEIALHRDSSDDVSYLQNALIHVPYLVLVEPEFAVPWTCPRDLSWRDLAEGRVKLASDTKNRFWYLTLSGNVYLQTYPLVPKQWERVFAPALEPDSEALARPDAAKTNDREEEEYGPEPARENGADS
ncbi:MAG: hypothetical protein IJL92_01260 [Thermoguttaceae bacterium]|nr:hypothetical protein [Thermoguttaceae bacterium]